MIGRPSRMQRLSLWLQRQVPLLVAGVWAISVLVAWALLVPVFDAFGFDESSAMASLDVAVTGALAGGALLAILDLKRTWAQGLQRPDFELGLEIEYPPYERGSQAKDQFRDGRSRSPSSRIQDTSPEREPRAVRRRTEHGELRRPLLLRTNPSERPQSRTRHHGTESAVTLDGIPAYGGRPRVSSACRCRQSLAGGRCVGCQDRRIDVSSATVHRPAVPGRNRRFSDCGRSERSEELQANGHLRGRAAITRLLRFGPSGSSAGRTTESRPLGRLSPCTALPGTHVGSRASRTHTR